MISVCKKAGNAKKYDCVIGVSGGVDSTYVAYFVKTLGLRPLAVHLDNGWNSELAVSNIKFVLEKLQIELHTTVLDWEEFRNLQLAFLKSSTPDSEIPTDHAIVALIRSIAAKEGVPIIWGVNFSSEAIMPRTWSQGHRDWAYIKKINKLFGTGKLKKYPHYSIWKLIFYDRILRQRIFSVLDYINYDKENAKKLLIDKLGWRDYGGKHHESIYTQIFQSYILPVKFGFDKRKAHYSSLILSGQMKREEAVILLAQSPYNPNSIENDIAYLCKKLDIQEDEFYDIMAIPPRKYEDLSPILPKKLKKLESIIFSAIISLWHYIKKFAKS